MVALSRSKLASLSTFLGRRQRFLPTKNLNLSLFSVHGLRKWQEMIFMYFRLELITAVLGPQAPWQSSLQTLKGCTCRVCKFGYYVKYVNLDITSSLKSTVAMDLYAPVSSRQTLIDYPAFWTPLNPEWDSRMKESFFESFEIILFFRTLVCIGNISRDSPDN